MSYIEKSAYVENDFGKGQRELGLGFIDENLRSVGLNKEEIFKLKNQVYSHDEFDFVFFGRVASCSDFSKLLKLKPFSVVRFVDFSIDKAVLEKPKLLAADVYPFFLKCIGEELFRIPFVRTNFKDEKSVLFDKRYDGDYFLYMNPDGVVELYLLDDYVVSESIIVLRSGGGEVSKILDKICDLNKYEGDVIKKRKLLNLFFEKFNISKEKLIADAKELVENARKKYYEQFDKETVVERK